MSFSGSESLILLLVGMDRTCFVYTSKKLQTKAGVGGNALLVAPRPYVRKGYNEQGDRLSDGRVRNPSRRGEKKAAVYSN